MAEATEWVRKSLGLLEVLTAAEPENAGYIVKQAVVRHTCATVLEDIGQLKPAEAEYRKVVELFDSLIERYPTELSYRHKAGVSRHNLAILIEHDGRLEESEKIHRRNLDFWERLAAGEPSNPDYLRKVAMTLESLAALLEKTGRKAELERALRRAAEYRSSLTRDFPSTPGHFDKLRNSLAVLAKLANARGDLTEGRRLQEQALAGARVALTLAPGNIDYIDAVAASCGTAADRDADPPERSSGRDQDRCRACLAHFGFRARILSRGLGPGAMRLARGGRSPITRQPTR